MWIQLEPSACSNILRIRIARPRRCTTTLDVVFSKRWLPVRTGMMKQSHNGATLRARLQDGRVQPYPLGEGPYQLFPVRISLGEVYERANLWQDAHTQYASMYKRLVDVLATGVRQDRYFGKLMLRVGVCLSRSLYHLGQ